MSRVRMVTRTVAKTVVTVLCVDTISAEPTNATYDIAGVFPEDAKGNKKLMEAIRKVYETDTFKIVSVVDKKVEEVLYGMPEQEFIQNAQILPARETTKESTIKAKPEVAKETKPNKKNNK